MSHASKMTRALPAPRPALRGDIQTLRAMAVAAVFANHLLGWPRGGFLGVDVFFVVSGFLITDLLLTEHRKTGRISLTAFFARRVKRIAPAALLTLCSTVVAAFFVLSPSRFAGTVTDALWALVFSANVRFERSSVDYFAADAPESPLEHFWSLSVEEQFYFVWPVLLIGLLTVTTRKAPAVRLVVAGLVLSFVIVVSFVLACALTDHGGASPYFSTGARIWELGLGCLLATLSPLLTKIPRDLRPLLGHVGFAGIVASAFLIDESFSVPGPWALMPVSATMLVLAAGTHRHGPSFSVLPFESFSAVRYLGDVSYSLYLWHFPVIVLLGAVLDDSQIFVPSSILLALALAVTSYHLVERPVVRSPALTASRRSPQAWRSWRASLRPTYVRGGTASLAGLTLLVTLMALAPTRNPVEAPRAATQTTAAEAPESGQDIAADPVSPPEEAALENPVKAALALAAWPETTPSMEAVSSPAYLKTLLDSSTDAKYYRCSTQSRSAVGPDCLFGPRTASKSAVVLGDSMGGFAFPAFGDFAADSTSTWKIRNATHFACPLVDLDITFDDRMSECASHKTAVLEMVRATSPDVVFIANAYTTAKHAESKGSVTMREWRDGTERMVSQIAATGARVVLMSPPPSDKNPQECWSPRKSPAPCVSRVSTVWTQRAADDKSLATAVAGIWIDTRPIFCSENRCPAVIGSTPVRFDLNHVTPDAARLTWPAYLALFRDNGVLE